VEVEPLTNSSSESLISEKYAVFLILNIINLIGLGTKIRIVQHIKLKSNEAPPFDYKCDIGIGQKEVSG
jgi:hypothetical protein